MTELERQLAEALRTLSAQFETEQRQHCGQVEALQQQVEILRQQVERLAGHVTTLTEHCADLAEKLLARWR